MSTNPAGRGHRLRTIGNLSDTYLGRTITLGDLTGTLAGLIPVGGYYQAVLTIGTARVYTDRLPANTPVEVWQKDARP